MNQLTIRGFGRDLEEKIRSLAERENISLNKAAVRFMRRGAGLEDYEKSDVIGNTLDHLAGTWTEEEAELMREVEKDLRRIDPEMWP